MSIYKDFVRKSFAKTNEDSLFVEDLIKLQKDSYDEFLQLNMLPEKRANKGLQLVLREFFPIVGLSGILKLEFCGYGVSEPVFSAVECKRKGLTYSGVISILLRLIVHDVDEDGKTFVKDVREQSVYIGDMPFMTDFGTFIINGTERVVVSQMHRSPGIFLDIEKKTNTVGPSYDIHIARIIPYRGSWIDVEFDSSNLMYIRIDKNKKIPLMALLMSLGENDVSAKDPGMSKNEILNEFYDITEFSVVENGLKFNLDWNKWIGSKFDFDILDATTGGIILKSGDLITKGFIKKLGDKSTKSLLINKDEFTDIYLTHDINEEVKVSDVVLYENLIEHGITSFKGVIIDGNYNTPYVIDSMRSYNYKNRIEAMVVLYNTMRPGERVKVDVVYALYKSIFSDQDYYNLSEVGRVKLNQKLGLNLPLDCLTLTKIDILSTIKSLIRLKKGEESVDDIDSLENRRVRSVGELVENQCRLAMGRFLKSVKDKMSGVDLESLMPSDLIAHSKSFTGVIREFFCTSQFSQFMDQTNPLSEISHKRRLSAFGPGGISRERSVLEARGLHATHYGRICPVETPEGQNIGLINSLSIFGKINKFGFIETPYHPVVDGEVKSEIVYFSASEDKKHIIAHADPDILDDNNKIKASSVKCRFNNDYVIVDPSKVQYIDVSPKQIISVASSLIPFVDHNDAGRALMGANMQRQAVPLIEPDSPLIGTGVEKSVVYGSAVVIQAKRAGEVVRVDSSSIMIKTDDSDLDVYNLRKFEKTNDGTCINQRPIVSVGQYVKTDELIAEGSSMDKGDLALGKNVKIAFLSWRGGNYEDAVLISSKLVNDFSSVHLEKYEVSAREIKQGIEQITRDIPRVNEEFLMHLDESGIVNIGANVKGGDVLVGRVTPKAEGPASADERLLRAIFGDRACDVKDSSLRVPPGVEGTVIDVRVFTRKGMEKNERALVIEHELLRKLQAQKTIELNVLKDCFVDKLCKAIDGEVLRKKVGKFAVGDALNKEILEEINLMLVPDIIKNPSQNILDIMQSYSDRINIITKKFQKEDKKISAGDDLVSGIMVTVQVFLAVKRKLQPGDKIAGRHGNKGVIARVLNLEDMPYTENGEPVDLIFSSLGISSRMNLGQILETHLGWASFNLGKKIDGMLSEVKSGQKSVGELREFVDQIYENNPEVQSKTDDEIIDFSGNLKNGVPFSCPAFDGASVDHISKMLELSGCDSSGQEVLYDGYTGLPFDRKVTVGIMYIMQLHHFVDEKIHARSVGPYSLITQQPLGGKSNFGGQRFGEMEVWALQGYGAAYTIRECLNAKSDDPLGRMRVFEAISQGYDVFDQQGVPESFRVLLYSLRSLCLNVECLVSVDGTLVEQDLNNLHNLDALRISIAGPEKVSQWSYGEVTRAETIHYRTLKPDPDGLFSARIFGPIKDYECLCGKYKKIKYRGVVCEKCGVEVTVSRVRRERMGHVNLAAPIAHMWFAKSLPSRIGIMLGLSAKDLEAVLNFEKYLVIEPATSPYAKGTLLSELEYNSIVEEYEDEGFEADTGAESLEKLLKEINLGEEISEINEELSENPNESKRKSLIRKLKILEGFYKSNTRPELCIIRVLPILPPELRPLVVLDGGRFASSDVNDLYRRVINRNNRLKRLLALNAPLVILRNEIRMLQESVDALFDNERKSRPIMHLNSKREYKSLAYSLKGKRGMFRQNLLGKRVDYSGRSVIVVGPELRLDQCGVPKDMALELFKPFVIARLELRGFAPTYKSAKHMVEHKRPEVWDVLAECIQDHPVLLNRAPTLHRLGIQAFNPVLVNGKAIRLHPLVCTAYNADFDGDQMAIHIPLSIEAQIEARVLMMSTNCLLNPSNGKAIVKPSKDMVLGLYYLTLMLSDDPKAIVRDIAEAEHALESGHINIGTPIRVEIEEGDKSRMVLTSLGRLKVYEITPKHPKIGFDMINKALNTSSISELVETIYEHCEKDVAVKFLDEFMNLGFLYATMSGSSFGKDDLIVPEEKHDLIAKTEQLVEEYRKQYMEGIITNGERHNKVTSAWSKCADAVAEIMMDRMSAIKDDQLNSVFMMSDSGARGSAMQIRQIAGMRGLIARSDGSIQEDPVKNSFKEGLTVPEFLYASEGGRKGLVDMALKTANSGYLTRRLVGVAQDCVVHHEDCGTSKGIMMKAIMQSGRTVVSLRDQLYGRTLSKNVILERDGNEVVIESGTIVTRDLAREIEEYGIEEVETRSPVSCENMDSTVCVKCYGYDLSKAKPTMVQDGESVGVVAAQSIGEPGTQLTMRTFHYGGAAQNISEDSFIDASENVTIIMNDIKIVNKGDYGIVMSRNNELKVKSAKKTFAYNLPYGSKIFVKDQDAVEAGFRIAEWDPYNTPILAEASGNLVYHDLIEGISLKASMDESTGSQNYTVSDWNAVSKKANLQPALKIELGNSDKEYYYSLSINDVILVIDKEYVEIGDVIATRSQGALKTRDIVGGLPRIEELFEARSPKSLAILNEEDGRVSFGKDYRSKKKIIVTSLSDGSEKEYIAAKDRYILAQTGDIVKKGQILVDGHVSHHDMLRILGAEEMSHDFIEEVQQVYRMQGITINDKHIEIILRRMLSQGEVLDPSSSSFLIGDIVDIKKLNSINEILITNGKAPIRFRRILQGITKISTSAGSSFLSAASFQDTARVLTNAALFNDIDWITGINESIMAGMLIPAGTGAFVRRLETGWKEELQKDFLTASAE
ncbi:DNA-directed RNA polymerase subunit beta' [Candidatus Cytomitobacter primus]|uniref:Multifunctional fusion protein n=1 Tax=Candidatus Cytomitobacter primus TaxID=2066024 RepID=A0A5C0UFA8_9PROT|nr:DNA-directed RNA polymerase subunit beta' [Candidatus Cytomitobacter primus]QEK38371.1 DNA-directed RNA polymerase subunit beta' [Candidatus Cytomitobacter primus]